MKQLNVNLSEEDEANLDTLIKAGKAHSRSAAIRDFPLSLIAFAQALSLTMELWWKDIYGT
jgi:hypothetical protein